MKQIILFSLMIVFTTLISAQSFWEKIESPTSEDLTSVTFVDSLQGWIGSRSGSIYHTTDGGITWSIQFENDSLYLINFCFLNEDTGFASAVSNMYEPYGSYILRTTNGGLNWTSTYLRIGEFYVNQIQFLDSLNGFVVGYPDVFSRTSDAGSTWQRVNLDSSVYAHYPPYSIRFYNENYGFACGGVVDAAGVIWRTTDQGYNWDTVVDAASAPAEPLYAIHFLDSLSIVVLGGDADGSGASIMRSSDGGNFWEYSTLGVLYFPVEAGFRTQYEGWAPLGPKQLFLYTSDSGQNWSLVPTPDSTNIRNISFPDSSHGFATGAGGTIIKYIYQNPNAVSSNTSGKEKFNLAQNYPNPFNPITSLSYKISSAAIVSLKVYNILGKEVTSLVNEYKPAGSYTVEFDGTNLPSGVYLCRMKAGEYSAVRKMLLIK